MNYFLHRLVIVVPLLFGITIITFIVINLAPGDPISAMIDPNEMHAISAQQVQSLEKQYGLDKPLPVRYVLWLKEALQGNLGYSLQSHQPVLGFILHRLPASLAITAPSLFLAILIGVTLGIFSALRQYSIFDHLLTVVAFFAVSVPEFFFALLGMYFLSVKLGWLPVFGMRTPGASSGINLDLTHHAILPVVALTLPQIAGYLRYARTAMLDAVSGDYVRTARAKGLREAVILRRHVFRNALLPLVTIAGLSLPGIIGGSFIIETIFSWPGIGLAGYTAILQRDYPVQMGIALFAAVAVLLANLLTDITYGLVDPRIRYE